MNQRKQRKNRNQRLTSRNPGWGGHGTSGEISKRRMRNVSDHNQDICDLTPALGFDPSLNRHQPGLACVCALFQPAPSHGQDGRVYPPYEGPLRPCEFDLSHCWAPLCCLLGGNNPRVKKGRVDLVEGNPRYPMLILHSLRD